MLKHKLTYIRALDVCVSVNVRTDLISLQSIEPVQCVRKVKGGEVDMMLI